MNANLRLHYQRQLIYAGLDDFNPNGVFPTYLGGRDGHHVNDWKREVAAFLDLGVQCGLINVTNWERFSSSSDLVSVGDFLLGLGSDRDSQLDESVVWNSLYFFGTESLIRDLDKFGLWNWGALKFLEDASFLEFIQNKYRVVILDAK
ncbi:hypothetical protein [Achromobacter xylosoxidans]|uniref:hypothetical protein n=1 Tax=Alcaligenes xylosoxydans xylosoxydans TaxID=85698 RepID=UPI0022B90B8A|nr:hypothetical protein [Achromobacter xylosoxidans]MCZ8390939.1 hypothetical protein [Achromobacter xylosoxidans]